MQNRRPCHSQCTIRNKHVVKEPAFRFSVALPNHALAEHKKLFEGAFTAFLHGTRKVVRRDSEGEIPSGSKDYVFLGESDLNCDSSGGSEERDERF